MSASILYRGVLLTSTQSNARPVTAYILSLIGGLIILLSGILASISYIAGNASLGWFGGMMGGVTSWQGMMGTFGLPYSYMIAFSLISLVSGAIVTIGALMLNSRPMDHTAWGTVILAFSVISFVGMGGFIIGAILGLAGGAYALSWRPR